MIQFKKAILLYLSCALGLVSISGCGGSSNEIPPPNGFLYSGNSARPGSMAAFTVTTGSLGHITNSPFATTANNAPNAPYSLAAWPPPQAAPAAAVTTKFLYGGIPASQKGGVITRVLGRQLVGTVTGGILMMPINSDHTLGTAQIVFLPPKNDDFDPIAVTPSPGNFLYAIDLTTSNLLAFSIDSNNGTLAAIGPAAGVAVGPDAFNVVVDPQGKFVLVANCNCVTSPGTGSVQTFSINGDGTLTSVGIFVPGGAASGAQPIALAVSPDSKFLFIASLDNKVYVESVTNGALTDQGNAALPAGSMPLAIAISNDIGVNNANVSQALGSYIYTGNAATHSLSFFINCVETNTNTATPCMGVVGPLGIPSMNSSIPFTGAVGAMLADPTNPPPTTPNTAVAAGFVYVTDYDHGVVESFSITSTDECIGILNCIPGTLTLSGASGNTGGVNPVGLAIAH